MIAYKVLGCVYGMELLLCKNDLDATIWKNPQSPYGKMYIKLFLKNFYIFLCAFIFQNCILQDKFLHI
jgi:hypothetical protein